jgi:hypothetical protein
MKSITRLLLLIALTSLALPSRAADLADATGIKDACIAGSLLDASGIRYRVVVFQSANSAESGCIYSSDGASYLYTPMGSAKINPAELGEISLQTVPRNEVFHIADGERELRNGCLVYATCAYAGYKRDPHITWAGIIAARVVNINNFGSDEGSQMNLTGHAITAFENDRREIFIQENGEDARKVDSMTELAQAGDTSWHDSSALIYCDHHIQGITTFNCEFGHPR